MGMIVGWRKDLPSFLLKTCYAALMVKKLMPHLSRNCSVILLILKQNPANSHDYYATTIISTRKSKP
uniref:Uncharacterized protein n=1 Tax=Rhizophora mucronata TaxID=61149 RepID=A0A2P2N707_RHIMU